MKAGVGMALMAGVAAFPLWARPLGANPFTLGVASGDPWPDGFVIWTRLAPKPMDEHGGVPAVRIPVRWEVAEDVNFRKVARSGEALALPELAHSVHVEVDGLKPHRHYWYRFCTAGSDMSMPGMARTAPESDARVQRVRIGVGGCQHYEGGYYGAWRHLSREPDLDLVFHYGDYIYESGANPTRYSGSAATRVRRHVGDETYSIDDYRRRYAQYKMDEDLQAAHAACAFAMSFDDHEIDNNWAGAFDQDGTPPEVFMLRRAAALQAWYEHMPVRRSMLPKAGDMAAYRRLDFGSLLRMHVLDTRSHRDDQPCADGKDKSCGWERHDADSMLGQRQEQWLDEGLGNAAAWNMIAQQVIMMPVDRRAEGESEGRHSTDSWDGYRPARRRLVESIKRHRLTNVVVASGDNHTHLAGEIPEDDAVPDGRKVAVEFETTSISSGGDGKGDAVLGRMLPNNPHIALYTDLRGYQVFDITPEQWTTELKVMDKVAEPDGTASVLQRYVVLPHAPMLHRA